MAKVYITEYSRGGRDNSDHSMQAVQLGVTAPVTQVLTKTGSNVVSTNALQSSTTMIRISTDTAVNFTFGTAPVATASDAYLPADAVEYFSVIPGSALKIAII